MSEYQYVGFRAIDRPVNGKDLEFMQRQSSRAEITTWSFDNEYHHGDFRGNAAEMLRRGYDFHLHYANFGIRTLMIRLPNGLPDEDAAKPYISKKTLKLLKDERGPGRILCVPPFFESGELDELWEPESLSSIALYPCEPKSWTAICARCTSPIWQSLVTTITIPMNSPKRRCQADCIGSRMRSVRLQTFMASTNRSLLRRR
jgi:hypothetical protein